jgi:hypothetical protein
VYAGAPVLAALTEQSEWIEDASPETADLDDITRAALAQAWLDDARKEHASIAAFTRLSAQLLAVGAPPSLLEEAHRAALDEIQHAQMCFTLASMYGGRWNGPGAMPMEVMRGLTADRATIAREALIEGCLGEGMAAVVADVMLGATTDESVKSVWESITRDERHHAEFAWELVRWCIDTGDRAVTEALASALGDFVLTIELPPLPPGIDTSVWIAHGRPSPEQLKRVHEVVRAEGPERIAPEWWRPGTDGVTRDYYRVEDAQGRRFWIFRAGLYGEGGEPGWFLHGLFA